MQMISIDFCNAIHLSSLVYYSEEVDLLFFWNGYSTINIYDRAGNPLDCFCLGETDELGKANKHMVIDSIENHITEIMNGEAVDY